MANSIDKPVICGVCHGRPATIRFVRWHGDTYHMCKRCHRRVFSKAGRRRDDPDQLLFEFWKEQ